MATSRRALLISTGLALGFLFVAGILRVFLDLPFAKLFRDPVSLAGVPHYYGMFSQMSLIIWSVAIGGLLLPYSLGRKMLGSYTGFMTYGLLLTLLLTLDDGFLLHESDSFKPFGIPVLYLVYVGGILFYLILFWRQILASPFPLLLVALGLLGFSMVFDEIPGRGDFLHSEMVYFIEDGCKLAGIIFWAAYQIHTGRAIIRGELIGSGSTASPPH